MEALADLQALQRVSAVPGTRAGGAASSAVNGAVPGKLSLRAVAMDFRVGLMQLRSTVRASMTEINALLDGAVTQLSTRQLAQSAPVRSRASSAVDHDDDSVGVPVPEHSHATVLRCYAVIGSNADSDNVAVPGKWTLKEAKIEGVPCVALQLVASAQAPGALVRASHFDRVFVPPSSLRISAERVINGDDLVGRLLAGGRACVLVASPQMEGACCSAHCCLPRATAFIPSFCPCGSVCVRLCRQIQLLLL